MSVCFQLVVHEHAILGVAADRARAYIEDLVYRGREGASVRVVAAGLEVFVADEGTPQRTCVVGACLVDDVGEVGEDLDLDFYGEGCYHQLRVGGCHLCFCLDFFAFRLC
ncbi:hypothetical protein AA313_de0207678 [Arthrobotrys entomopaga]|nr:hypothetical protein AA313_de0207678 [Arthrobotrys entomopaga]